MIFDQRTVDASSFGSSLGSGYAINREGHRWSKGLIKEVEMGLVKKAGSIRDLADLIKVPSDALDATVTRWNKDMAAGKNTEFGRPIRAKGKQSYAFDGPVISAPINEGPFCALELYPTLVNNQGGLKKN